LRASTFICLENMADTSDILQSRIFQALASVIHDLQKRKFEQRGTTSVHTIQIDATTEGHLFARLSIVGFDDSEMPTRKNDLVIRLVVEESLDANPEPLTFSGLATKAGLKPFAPEFSLGIELYEGVNVPNGQYYLERSNNKQVHIGHAKGDRFRHSQDLIFNREDLTSLLKAVSS